MTEINFPTGLHKQTVNVIKDFFYGQKNVDTILLTNSLAREKATADSDIDFAILVSHSAENKEIIHLESIWQDFLVTNQTLNQYKNSNKFSQIHLDIIDGVFKPAIWEDGGAVDFFEV